MQLIVDGNDVSVGEVDLLSVQVFTVVYYPFSVNRFSWSLLAFIVSE